MATSDRAPRRTRSRTTFALLGGLLLFVVGIAAGVLWHAELGRMAGLHEAATVNPGDSGQLYTCGMHPQVIQDHPGTCPICGMALTPIAGGGAGPAEGANREIRYWWDPMMNPPYISDRPGQSPMGMDLVPVYADEIAAGAAVTIDPVVVQNMGLRLGAVVEAPLSRRIRAVGILEEPEPARHDVNLRVGGWIERLHADTEGAHLEAGAPLFDLYSPELQVAVEELIGARALGDSGGGAAVDALRRAAERKLELYGIPDERIAELARLDRAPRAVTFTSPAAGFLVEKSVYAGAAIEAGDTVMRIADTTTLWLDVHVFEKDLSYVRVGQEATATVDAAPGRAFGGAVILVLPRIDPATRTATVRIEIENPDLSLRHGMFATAELGVELAAAALVVPREAVIDTGTRQVAFVALPGGRFEPREVAMGAEGDDGRVQVLSGLAPGEEVVVAGQFLLDAESRMKEAVTRFLERERAPTPTAGEGSGSATADPLGETTAGWRSAADDALGAYLEIARALGTPQESDLPIEVSGLVRATEALAAAAAGERQSALAGAFVAVARALERRPIEEQRRLFVAASNAAIELAERSPRPGRVASRLFVAYCPMMEARWLQESEEIANPYYATTMKSCGSIERAIPIPVPTPGPAAPDGHGGHGGGGR